MFRFHLGHHNRYPSMLGSGLLFNGLLCVLFGLAILSAPELLAYLVAIFLLVVGTSLIVSWWKIRSNQ